MIPALSFDPKVSRIGLHSPSGPVGAFPRRVERALATLGSLVAPGLTIALHALDRNVSPFAAPALRCADLEELLRDPSVGLIMSTTGGYASIATVARADIDLFIANPKPIVGFSDATALVLALHALSGVVTFHGPALLPNFGEPAHDPFSWNSLLDAVSTGTEGSIVAQPDRGFRTFRMWDRDDDAPETAESIRAPVSLHDGVAAGPLLGGNLDTLLALLATPYMPDLRGAVLFWEVAFCSAEKLQRDLACLEAAGVFGSIAGMVVGTPYCLSGADDDLVFSLARDLACRHRLPTIAGLFIGHCQPIATLPVGVPAQLDATRAELTLLAHATVRPQTGCQHTP